MIAMLRRKITAAAICALLLIFAAVVASINVAYRQTLRSQISQSLQILTGDSAQSAPSQPRTRSGLPAVHASSLSRVTDYCVIRLDREGAVHEWKSENAAGRHCGERAGAGKGSGRQRLFRLYPLRNPQHERSGAEPARAGPHGRRPAAGRLRAVRSGRGAARNRAPDGKPRL